jgi:hypothetical protein
MEIGGKNVPSDENQTECHEIEPNASNYKAMPKRDNPSFGDKIAKFTFFLTAQFIFVFKSKYRSTQQLCCRDPRGLTVHQQRPQTRC